MPEYSDQHFFLPLSYGYDMYNVDIKASHSQIICEMHMVEHLKFKRILSQINWQTQIYAQWSETS